MSEPGGRTVGVIGRKMKVGKPVYTLHGPDGTEVGAIRGEDWRSRKFAVVDPAGNEFGRVTKQWRGLFTEVVTDADSYAVTFEPHATSDQRALAFAGALQHLRPPRRLHRLPRLAGGPQGQPLP